jgi:hypothetical protein
MNKHGYDTHSQSQLEQQYPHQGAYGIQHDPRHSGYTTPTTPSQPHARTGVTVIVDTNVLLDYLMVIQKFVADIERMKWPSVIVIPSVVISELDWCIDSFFIRSPSNRQWSDPTFFRLI